VTCTSGEADLDVTWVHPANPVYREVDHQKTVVVNFMLDMEFRSWGLKSIEVIPSGTVNIPLFVRDYATVDDDNDTVREIVVSVDLSKCKVNYTAGDGYGTVAVTGFDLHLTSEWKVDYRFSEVQVVR